MIHNHMTASQWAEHMDKVWGKKLNVLIEYRPVLRYSVWHKDTNILYTYDTPKELVEGLKKVQKGVRK